MKSVFFQLQQNLQILDTILRPHVCSMGSSFFSLTLLWIGSVKRGPTSPWWFGYICSGFGAQKRQIHVSFSAIDDGVGLLARPRSRIFRFHNYL